MWLALCSERWQGKAVRPCPVILMRLASIVKAIFIGATAEAEAGKQQRLDRDSLERTCKAPTSGRADLLIELVKDVV